MDVNEGLQEQESLKDNCITKAHYSMSDSP